MKKSRILATLIILQILTQAVFAQQEPQPQAVQQEPQQIIQQEPEQAVPQEPQQIVQQEPQQMVQQEQQQAAAPQESGPPANTITLDLGPTIIGIAFGAVPTGDLDISGFGFGLQYERQLFERLSVAGRFAYLGTSIEYSDKDSKFSQDLSSFSLEAHPRVYPFGGSFFLDGMFGYANVSLDLKGKVETDNGPRNAKISISRSYSKFGGKLGWRADFGEPGGFIFEHSYGYYSASGFGNTMGKRASKEISKQINEDVNIGKDVDDAFALLEDFLFVGGPRVTFAFGWKF